MWEPQWHHVTQIHADGSGWNDCAEASLARYLLEAWPHFGTTGEWALVGQVRDPQAAPGVWDLISRLGEIGRGIPDQPGQGFTSAAGIQAILNAFGVSWTYVDGAAAFDAAKGSYWGLCWVDGCQLAPATYPADYFGNECGSGNHIILWLPNQHGIDNLFNDPLSVQPDIYSDARYDLGSVQGALYGAWLLPATGHGEDTPAGVPRVIASCALKRQPNHVSGVVAMVRGGTAVSLDTGTTPHWQQVALADGKSGWLLKDNIHTA